MDTLVRQAEVIWRGELASGSRLVTTFGGVSNGLGNGSASSHVPPEQLVAASIGSCYAMSLWHDVVEHGFHPDLLEIEVRARLDEQADHVGVREIAVAVSCSLPGMERWRFRDLAEQAYAGNAVICLLGGAARCTLTASLNSEQVSGRIMHVDSIA